MVFDPICMKHFGERLREIRKKSGLSQDTLAKELGISKGALCYYENGERTPDIVFLEKVSEYYQVRVEYLLGLSNSMDGEFAPITDITPLSEKAAENLIDLDPDGAGKILNSLLESDEFIEVLYLIECAAHSPLRDIKDGHRLVDIGYRDFVIERLLLNAIKTVLRERNSEVLNSFYHSVFSDEELKEYLNYLLGGSKRIDERIKQFDEENKMFVQECKEEWEGWDDSEKVREVALKKLRKSTKPSKEGD